MRADFRPTTPRPPVLRVFSETIPLASLAGEGDAAPAARAFPLLRRFGVRILAAVRPWELAHVRPFLDRAAAAGVSAGLWPMLADGEGRWASLENGARYLDFARRVLDAAGDAPLAEMTVDLEPPFERVARWVALRPRVEDVALPMARALGALPRPFARASAAREAAVLPYAHLVRELSDRDVASTAVLVPFVLFDRKGWPAFEAAMGTPVDGLAWDSISVMLYTSLFEGWSPRVGGRRVLDRRRSLALFAAGARAARVRFGERAGVSVGAVGVGALGNEPVYRDPSELGDDARAARAAGVFDVSLLDLGGVLARGPAEAWFEALTG